MPQGGYPIPPAELVVGPFGGEFINDFLEIDEFREIAVFGRQSEIYMAAVQQNGLALEHVKEQTPEICLAAVRQNGLALKFVKDKTSNIRMAAVQQNGLALRFMRKKTVEECVAAIKQDYSAK